MIVHEVALVIGYAVIVSAGLVSGCAVIWIAAFSAAAILRDAGWTIQFGDEKEVMR